MKLFNQASLLAIMIGLCAQQAHAQQAPASNEVKESVPVTPDNEITVTGSRIVQDGYSAPTPVNVLGAATISALRPSNLSDLVNQMPSVAGAGITTAASGGSTSSGRVGISSVNLRGLGAQRTLVLLDGRRTPPSSENGITDLNTIPQDLVKRVEIVTGGASAQYGSDAVGGVVNFILDTGFKGLRLTADAGVTTYGDGKNYRVSGSWGFTALDDRLHVLVNGEYFHQEPIVYNDRAWNQSGFQRILNPAYTATNGQPRYIVGPNSGLMRTAGGLINSPSAGSLYGTYFLGNGVAGRFNYGSSSSASAPWIKGGDWQLSLDGVAGTNGLLSDDTRKSIFNRVAFDITPDITLYGQFSWVYTRTKAYFSAAPLNLTIASDNAYLLTQYPQVAAQVQANNLASFTLNTWTHDGGVGIGGGDTNRNAYRYLGGVQGKFSLFDHSWSWDAYYQHGVIKQHEQTINSTNVARRNLAVDAVLSNGQIVCRSTLTDPTNGCVPLDVLGTGTGPSTAAFNYIYGPEQPWRNRAFTQDVVAANLNGQLFDLPGGPVAVALGGEWRKDQLSSVVGPNVAGAAAPLGWSAGNYARQSGQITVKEAFIEVGIPLFKGFNFDGAARYTDYSSTGSVATWKVGATYSPIPDIKFRGAYSHDIRAPNISELYVTGTLGQVVAIVPSTPTVPGYSKTVFANNVANPNLKPEASNTLTLGVVATPSFLPGFSASIDYWDIKLKDVISTVGTQDYIDFCYNGLSQFCGALVSTGGVLTAVNRQPVNFASQNARGLDFEVSYATQLSAISEKLPGSLQIHASATRYLKNVVDNRVTKIDYAGAIQDPYYAFTPASPAWVYRVSATYDVDPVTVTLIARGSSSGVYGNNFVQCTSSCPTSTTAHPTIDNNHINGSLYFDGSVGVKLRAVNDDTRLTFIVTNIFNRSPVNVGIDPTSDGVGYPQTVRPLYDTLGRTFKLSLTTKL